jgi:hypothetical protein
VALPEVCVDGLHAKNPEGANAEMRDVSGLGLDAAIVLN